MEKLTPFKEMSKQDKISYIWDYWKWPIIAVIFAISVVFSIAKTIITHKDPNIGVLMINSCSKDTSVFEEMLSSNGYDSNVLLNANLGFSEEGNPTGFYLDDTVLSANLNSGSFDLFFGNGEKFIFCANDGYLIDLSTVLPAELLDSIPDDHLLYSTVGDRMDAFPCAILFDNCEELKIYYPEDAVYGGIIYNNPNPENAVAILKNLLIK